MEKYTITLTKAEFRAIKFMVENAVKFAKKPEWIELIADINWKLLKAQPETDSDSEPKVENT